MLELLAQRGKIIESGASSFELRLLALADNIGRRLAASLGSDPDDVRMPDGDDGVRVGRTGFEQRLQSIGEAEALRAAVLGSSLVEIEDLIEAAGLGDARDVLRGEAAKLAGLAERSLTVQGITAAEGALATVAAEALLTIFFETQIDETLIGTISRNSAIRIRQALGSSLGHESVSAVASRIADAEEMSVGMATTEARTRLQMADRMANEVVRSTMEETGASFLLAYLGPHPDSKLRAFCSRLYGPPGKKSARAYRLDDFNLANNHMTAEHPRIAGGGYNCRHYVQPVINDDDVLADLGLVRGTVDDVRAANRAAQSSRKRKKKRGRK